jgi:NhaA family Na+:H+ antiporter
MIGIRGFLKKETSPGILLMLATLLALIFANTGLASPYANFLATPFEVRLGEAGIGKPLILWINDGLMAVFFFLIGLELKREVMGGELADRRKVMLPLAGAIGGMAVPALIYAFINRNNPSGASGWAIPAATDIAFALGILALLGSRVPPALKIFLASLAIFDDLGAIVIIAIFYTENLSVTMLLLALPMIGILYALNHFGVASRIPYLLVTTVLWVTVLKSGVHATLAGVVAALFIPMTARREDGHLISPLKTLEHDLHPWVAFGILPVFAFANAGLSLSGLTFSALLEPVPLGIALGLFLGKQLGIFSLCFLAVKFGIASLPSRVNFGAIYGVALISGIGFTMSLFIASLAFEGSGDASNIAYDRLGIMAGSLLSAICGVLILLRFLPLNGNGKTTAQP